MKILLIDDDEDCRQSLMKALIKIGHMVFEAADGKEGLIMLEKMAFDLVITDIIMPETDGLELLTLLHHRRPALPVIAITGAGRLDPMTYYHMAKRLGAVDYLQKPFPVQNLIDSVRKASQACCQ